MISITKKIEFEAAHRLSSYDGPCREIHGHTYKLEVTVSGQVLNETDMILDFKTLKKIIKTAILDQFDHSLILKDNTENRLFLTNYPGKIFWMETEPTGERMILVMVQLIHSLLPQSIRLDQVVLYETSNSYLTWKNKKG